MKRRHRLRKDKVKPVTLDSFRLKDKPGYTVDITKDIIDEMSSELGYSVEDIGRCIDAQRMLTAETIQEGEFRNIKWSYLGSFKINVNRIMRIVNPDRYTAVRKKELRGFVRERDLAKLKKIEDDKHTT